MYDAHLAGGYGSLTFFFEVDGGRVDGHAGNILI